MNGVLIVWRYQGNKVRQEKTMTRETINVLEGLEGIQVLVRHGSGTCDRCVKDAEKINVCQAPDGEYYYLCDHCVADIWSRANA
jgi:hypothetical protein